MLQSRVRPGELDRRITFIRKVLVNGVSNEDYITNWEVLPFRPQTWARKKDLRGQELVIADRLTYVQHTLYTIRYRTDITVEMRIVLDGKVYEIVAITENESSRKGYLDITANLLDTETFEIGSGFTVGFSTGYTA